MTSQLIKKMFIITLVKELDIENLLMLNLFHSRPSTTEHGHQGASRPYLPFGRRNKTIKSIYSKNLSISLLSDLDFFQRAASGTALEWARRKQSLITRLRDQLATCGFQNIAALAIEDNILRPHILHESGRCPTKPKLEVAMRLGGEYF